MTELGDAIEETSADRFSQNVTVAEVRRRLQHPATGAVWRAGIAEGAETFRGRPCLDLGADFGFRALLLLEFGASHVFVVPETPSCREITHRVLDLNGAGPKTTVLGCTVDEVRLPLGAGPVAAITADWVGRSMLYGSLAPAVLRARDRYLAADGVVLPATAALVIRGVSNCQRHSQRIAFWNNVYGFNMTCMASRILIEPTEMAEDEGNFISDAASVQVVDLQEGGLAELSFTAPLELNIVESAVMDGFAVSADVGFLRGTTIRQPCPAVPVVFYPLDTALDVQKGKYAASVRCALVPPKKRLASSLSVAVSPSREHRFTVDLPSAAMLESGLL